MQKMIPSKSIKLLILTILPCVTSPSEFDVSPDPEKDEPAAPFDVTGITSTWWSQSIARITWTTSQESHQSHDKFLVYLNQQLVAEEDLPEKSFSIDGLDLCKNYFVRVEAVFRDQVGQSYEKQIRNWTDPDGMKEILDQYPNALEKCGKCSNIEKNKLCSFPFKWDNAEYNTCTTRIPSDKQIGTDKQLKCLTLEDEEISCSPLSHCLPPLPTLYGLTIQTIAIGAVAMSWKASSDELDSYKIYLNGDEKNYTTITEYNLTSLEVGHEYEFEVRVSSFERISQPERISFVASDKKENAFALNQTTESADIIWDANEDDESGESSTQVDITVDNKPLLKRLLGDSGFKNLSRKINIDEGGTRLSLVNLVAGVKYFVTVTKTVTGVSNSTNSTALETAVTTIPRPLEEEENGLVLAASNGTKGLELSGFITANTYSEKLNFIFTVQNVSSIVEKDGKYSYIAGVEETKRSAEDACLTEECVKRDEVNFVRRAFDGNLIKGGVYVVDAISQTGNAEAEMVFKIYHITPPNPVQSLTAYSVAAYQIRFLWGPPPTGLFQGFIVEYIDDSGNLIEEELGGYLRYSADELEPGYSYTFNVFAIAKKPNDDAEMVKSVATQIQQDAAPLHPEEVASKHNFYENKFEISVDSPAEGTWHHFEVTYDDFYHPVGKKLAVFDNSSSTGEMKFDRYGAVYQLKVWAVSTNGVKSSYATEHLLLTDPEKISDVELIFRNDTEMCFLWKLEKDNSFYHKVTGNLIQESVELVASPPIEIEREQTSGVFCFDVSGANKAKAVRLELITTVEYPPDVIEQPKDVVSYPKNADFNGGDILIEHTLKINSSCEPGKCTVSVGSEKLPWTGLIMRYRLAKRESTGRSRRSSEEIFGEFSGSECADGSQTCIFTLDNLPFGTYQMFLTVSLYGFQVGEVVQPEDPLVIPLETTAPMDTTTPIDTTTSMDATTSTDSPGSPFAWYFFVLIGAGVFIIVLAGAIVVWICTGGTIAVLINQQTTPARKDSGDYNELNVYEDYDKLQTDNVYQVPNFDATGYGELSGGVDITHPKYANHVYERTMEEVNEIVKSDYAEASLNSRGAPRDATQVEVNVGASGEQGEHDQTHDPRYV